MMINASSLIAIMGIPSAVTGFFFWLLKRYIDKRERQRDDKDAHREKHDLLLMKCVSASIALGEATAIALRDGKTNGETEHALKLANEAKSAQADFLTEQAIKKLHEEN